MHGKAYKVIEAADKRMGAKIVPQYAENLTPQSELDKLKTPVETFFLKRDRGTGRPTKKERRQMDSLWDALSLEVPDDVADRFAAEFGFDDEMPDDKMPDDDSADIQ